MTARKLLILGAGGHGRVVADAAIDAGFEDVAFLDDGPLERSPEGFRKVGKLADVGSLLDQWPSAISAVGNNGLRLELYRRLKDIGYTAPAIIHPRAFVSRNASIADGVFVAAGAVVNTGASIDVACIINTSASVDHDCRIGAGTHISPGAHLAGEVVVGSKTWIGIGSSVRNRVCIGDDVTVGAGAAVINDVPAGLTVVGAPARPLRPQ